MTPHFKYDELTVTGTGLDNTPDTDEHMTRLLQLAMNMEHVREIIGQPIIIMSAYRNSKVNEAVGGVKDSHHCEGFAVDFIVKGWTPYEVCQSINRSWLPYDQLINEQEKGITHISFAPAFRRQLLTQVGKTYVHGNRKG